MTTLTLGNASKGRVFGSSSGATTAEGVVLVVQNRSQSNKLRRRFTGVAFGSPNELCAVDERGSVWAFDVRRVRDGYREVARLPGVAAFCVSRSGPRTEILVAAGKRPMIHVYDFSTGALRCQVKLTRRAPVTGLDAHRSRRLALTYSPHSLELWDAVNWVKLRSPGSRDISCARFSNAKGDGVVVVLHRDGSIRTLAVARDKKDYHLAVLLDIPAVPCELTCLAAASGAIAAGGRLVCQWTAEKQPRIVDAKERVVQLEYCKDELLALCDDGRLIALKEAGNKTVVAYDVKPRGGSAAVHFAVSGDTLALATSDGSLLLLNVAYLRKQPEREEAAPPRPAPSDQAPPVHRVPRLRCDRGGLVALLRQRGEYPPRHRALIWRSLLDLPENDAAFSNLTQGSSQEVKMISEVKCRRTRERLLLVVKAAARWCPALGLLSEEEDYWLPSFAYPLVQVFGGDTVCCFEAILSILKKYAVGWLFCAPEPPIFALAELEGMLFAADEELAHHLNSVCLNNARYWGWPVMRSLFGECLPKDQWLRLWDSFLTSGDEARLQRAVVALTQRRRGEYLDCTDSVSIEAVARRPCSCPDLASRSVELIMSHADIDPALAAMAREARLATARFDWPRSGEYPVLTGFPSRAVDFARREHAFIKREHADCSLEASEEAGRIDCSLLEASEEAERLALRQVEASLRKLREERAELSRRTVESETKMARQRREREVARLREREVTLREQLQADKEALDRRVEEARRVECAESEERRAQDDEAFQLEAERESAEAARRVELRAESELRQQDEAFQRREHSELEATQAELTRQLQEEAERVLLPRREREHSELEATQAELTRQLQERFVVEDEDEEPFADYDAASLSGLDMAELDAVLARARHVIEDMGRASS